MARLAFWFRCLFILLLGVQTGGRTACAFDGPDGFDRFKRRTETGFRIGADRRLNISHLWQPLWQSYEQLVFLSVRTSLDNFESFEGNLGLGYRTFTGKTVYGAYLYADRRVTPFGSIFYQGTLGAEYIRPDWEMRANVYIPVNATRRYTDSSDVGIVLTGTGIGVREAGTQIEEARAGLDAEIGMVLPDNNDFAGQTRLYGGAYYFRGEHTAEIAGVRARLETDVTEWMKLGGRIQYDEERGAQYMVEATFRWPKIKTTKTQGIRARLGDSPERDVDIVVGANHIDGPIDPVVDADTGAPIRIVHVDNTASAGGNGSAEDPFPTLGQGLAVAGQGDIVYIATGDGTTTGYDQGAHLTQAGITLSGSGTAFMLDGNRYRTGGRRWTGDLIVRRADARSPLLSNSGGDALVLDAPNLTIKGIQVDGSAGNGVYLTSAAEGAVLDHLVASGNNGNGIYIDNAGGANLNVRIRDSVVSGNLLSGVRIETTGGAVHLDMGTAGDYGYNDVFGNIGDSLSVDNGGVTLPARGNYWGGGALTEISGPDIGSIDSSTYVGTPFCESCRPSLLQFGNYTDVLEGSPFETATKTVDGFFGHRYIRASGEGNPEWIVNGNDTGSGIARVQAGDEIAVQVRPSTVGYQTRNVALSGAGISQTIQVQTRFLPNAHANLVGWWDGHDVEGDFDVSDHPVNGTILSSWEDKTGLGHVGTSMGNARPLYDAETGYVLFDSEDDQMSVGNSFALSALGGEMTLAFVLKGTPHGSDTTIFSYGECTGGPASRCLALKQGGASQNMAVRVDTGSAQNQNVSGPALLDGAPHLIWVHVNGAGDIRIRQDGENAGDGVYSAGGGFSNTSGLILGGAIGGGYGEILLFNGGLSETDRNQMESYLMSGWGFNP